MKKYLMDLIHLIQKVGLKLTARVFCKQTEGAE